MNEDYNVSRETITDTKLAENVIDIVLYEKRAEFWSFAGRVSFFLVAVFMVLWGVGGISGIPLLVSGLMTILVLTATPRSEREREYLRSRRQERSNRKAGR